VDLAKEDIDHKIGTKEALSREVQKVKQSRHRARMTPEKPGRSYLIQKIFLEVVGVFFFMFSIRILQFYYVAIQQQSRVLYQTREDILLSSSLNCRLFIPSIHMERENEWRFQRNNCTAEHVRNNAKEY
jgi:hypothetical protein